MDVKQGSFYSFLTYAKNGNAEFTSTNTTIPTAHMEISQFRVYDKIYNLDLTKKYIPIAYIKSTSKGTISGGLSKDKNDEIEFDENYNYLIFYLRIRN